MRDRLAIAQSESQKMKKINKELLDSIIDGEQASSSVSKHKNSLASLLDSYTEIDLDGVATNQSTETTTNTFRKRKTKELTRQTSKVSNAQLHSLYQDLYLTDLKDDVGKLQTDLGKQQVKNLEMQQTLAKYKKEIAGLKRTIANYRKAVADMQKDFFAATPSQGNDVQSSIYTMTSFAMLSGFKRSARHLTEEGKVQRVSGEIIPIETQTSQFNRENELGDTRV